MKNDERPLFPERNIEKFVLCVKDESSRFQDVQDVVVSGRTLRLKYFFDYP